MLTLDMQIIPGRYARTRLRAIEDNQLIVITGHTVTVFGATGFLGRYIVNRLGTN